MTLDALTYDDSLGRVQLSAQGARTGPCSLLTTRPTRLRVTAGRSGGGLDWERDGLARQLRWRPATKLSRGAAPGGLPAVDVVLVEQAHMRERWNPYSVAQVYTADELARLPFRDPFGCSPARRSRTPRGSPVTSGHGRLRPRHPGQGQGRRVAGDLRPRAPGVDEVVEASCIWRARTRRGGCGRA